MTCPCAHPTRPEDLVRCPRCGRARKSVPSRIPALYGVSSPMKRSVDRFLTTHTGSLPRPPDLVDMMFAKEEGVPVESAALASRIRGAVAEVVQKQLAA